MSDGPRRCAIDSELAAELPGLRMWELTIAAGDGRTTAGLRQQLRMLSDRVTGASAIELRRQAVPHAYRVLFRHVGLDPDLQRTPVEQAVLDRLAHGGFRSHALVADALLVALVETGVPVWALDDAALDEGLTLRLGTTADAFVPAGRLAVADATRAVGELFGPAAEDVHVTKRTERIRLYTVAAPGVPEVHADEALEIAADAISGG